MTGGFPSQRPVTRGFDTFFDLRPNKRQSKQSRRRWLETPSRSLWRHCNETAVTMESSMWLLMVCRLFDARPSTIIVTETNMKYAPVEYSSVSWYFITYHIHEINWNQHYYDIDHVCRSSFVMHQTYWLMYFIWNTLLWEMELAHLMYIKTSTFNTLISLINFISITYGVYFVSDRSTHFSSLVSVSINLLMDFSTIITMTS